VQSDLGAATPALLFDIEGTLASMAIVHELLFPYARRRLSSFLREDGHQPAVREALEQVRADAAEKLPSEPTEASLAAITEHLERLMDQDAKTTGLKQLQGLIWEHGFQSGQLQVALFPDCLPRLQAWKQAGRKLFIYSSGSIHAQKLFFQFREGRTGTVAQTWIQQMNAAQRPIPARSSPMQGQIRRWRWLSQRMKMLRNRCRH
jgi:enolase-phosphatase E1